MNKVLGMDINSLEGLFARIDIIKDLVRQGESHKAMRLEGLFKIQCKNNLDVFAAEGFLRIIRELINKGLAEGVRKEILKISRDKSINQSEKDAILSILFGVLSSYVNGKEKSLAILAALKFAHLSGDSERIADLQKRFDEVETAQELLERKKREFVLRE